MFLYLSKLVGLVLFIIKKNLSTTYTRKIFLKKKITITVATIASVVTIAF